jgi:hypothetical protein
MTRAEDARREASAPSVAPPGDANGATGSAPPLPPVIKVLPQPKPRAEQRPAAQHASPQQAEQAKPAPPKPLVGRPLDLLGAQ